LNKGEVKIRVTYADTDAMGIVYHTNYIKWFEIGRTEFFRNMGFAYTNIEAGGYFLPVSEAYCHYISSARYDDVLVVTTELDYIRRVSIKFLYTIMDEHKEREMAEGYTLHAFTDKSGNIVRAPEYLIKGINT
jgi:acyl-CoA thioester hydrolase